MQFTFSATAAAILMSAVSVAAQISFPSVCANECSLFGSVLIAKCVMTPLSTNSMETSAKIATCFCDQYAAGSGQTCVACIGNQPSLAGKASTVLFTTLATQCTNPNDLVYAAAAVTIDPIVRDAVVQNVVVAGSNAAGTGGSMGGGMGAGNSSSRVSSVVPKTTTPASSWGTSQWASIEAFGAVAGVVVAFL
ncbi:hypothetical protein BJ741DRAFT_593948 [Chytriomyces cf. hyalinus JEL632]|nr:hypothetical protein BJ741DRAFT_593948 [Chytriomyces cf. hyalinus JEL632]